MSGWTLACTLLAVAAGGVLLGAIIGYYTAQADQQRAGHHD